MIDGLQMFCVRKATIKCERNWDFITKLARACSLQGHVPGKIICCHNVFMSVEFVGHLKAVTKLR